MDACTVMKREKRHNASGISNEGMQFLAMYREINVYGRKQRYTEIKFRNERRISIHLDILLNQFSLNFALDLYICKCSLSCKMPRLYIGNHHIGPIIFLYCYFVHFDLFQ